MEFKVKFAYLKSAIYIMTKNGSPRPERSISSDQAELTVIDGFLQVVCHGHHTLIPLSGVSSLVPMKTVE